MRLRSTAAAGFQASLAGLDELWQQLHVLDVDEALVRAGADLARRHSLRGFDAVHCAAGVRVLSATTVGLSGDTGLVTAWSAEGLATIDTTALP